MSRRRKTTYVGYFPNRHSFARAARDKSSWVLPNGMYSNQARGCLKKCWTGFRIAKANDDKHNMIYYAAGIQKFARQLGLQMPSFPDLNMFGMGEPEDNAEYMQNERIGYEDDSTDLVNQELDEHEEEVIDDEDPYGFEAVKKRNDKYFKSLNM
jgi:hypothetical protein